jgi:3-phosphoshikimate 1-carboxyvinyltransferase
MQQRPIQELLDALSGLGIAARSTASNGCPPVEVVGGQFSGGRTRVDCRVSSQYLSALLLIAPLARQPVEIEVSRGLVSRPYVDMTIDVMEQFGIQVERRGYEQFTVATGQRYRAQDISVEPDCSQAGYFWAAAAVAGGSVKVHGTRFASRQGDVRLADCFGRMGCEVNAEADGIRVSGRPLKSITVDMADMPDMVPTLAVVAAFAEGTTVIENVAHLKA